MIEQAGVANEILVAVLGLLIVVGFYVVRGREERQALLLIATLSYLLKAIMVPVYYWILVQDGVGGFAFFDSLGYHQHAEEMAFELAHGLPRTSAGWTYKDPGYNIVCALLYLVFGSSTLIARFFNATISTFTLLYIYRIAKISFDKEVAKVAVRLGAFLPFPIFMTVNHRKEPVVIFVATLLFYHALRVLTQQKNWVTSLASLAFWIVPIFFLRGGFVLTFAALLLIMFLLTQRSILVGTLLASFVAVALIGAQFLLPNLDPVDIQQNLQEIDQRFAATAESVEGSGGLLRYVKATSPLDLWKVPIAAFLLVLLPFPPRFPEAGRKMYPFILAIAHMVFLVFLPQFFLGCRELFRREDRKRRLPLFIYTAGFLCVIGAFAVGVMRYRETVFPIIVVITAAGIRAPGNLFLSGAVYVTLMLLAAVINATRYVF